MSKYKIMNLLSWKKLIIMSILRKIVVLKKIRLKGKKHRTLGANIRVIQIGYEVVPNLIQDLELNEWSKIFRGGYHGWHS